MIRIYSIFILLFLYSCQSQLQVKEQHAQNLRMKGDSLGVEDAKIKAIIAPYKLSLDSQMDVKIIMSSEELKKDNPEGTLGNMVCDVLMQFAKSKGETADFCILNNGGLRIPVLYKGAVTLRTLYELMPFDNQLVLLKISGSKCAELFDAIAVNNGVPVSGLNLIIENEKATSIKINGIAFDPTKDYWVLTSDYLANGGDKTEALKNPLENKNTNRLIRDVLIVQMQEMNKNGETLKAIKDGRISKK